MFKTVFAVVLLCVFEIEAKFYETDLVPYGRYSTHEYDSDVGYPYGLAYKKYPYEHGIGGPKAIGYGGVVPGLEYGPARGLEYGPARALEYGPGRGLEYAGLGGRVGYGGGYYGHKGLIGAPLGIGQGIGYGYGPTVGYSQVPYGPGFVSGHAPYGISQIDKGVYNDGRQNIVGGHFNYVKGQNGELLNRGDAGYATGAVAFKDIKGDSAHFVDADGLKKGHHEGKQYNGGEYFDTEGKHGDEKILNANHNKGHNIKGFKKSHHLDETGKTEEFFDQDHDQGGNFAFNGRFGKFGENGGQAFKGGYSDGRYKTGEATKEGHIGNEYFQDKAQGNHGKFGENKFAENQEAYGLNKGFGEHGLTGYHENSNVYKHHPSLGYY